MFRTVSQEPQPQCLGKSLEQIHSSSQPVSRHRQAESEGDAIRPIARESQVVPGDDDKDVQREEMEIEEPLEARIERLGRQRPAVFHSIWKEIAFVFSINMSMLLSVSHCYRATRQYSYISRNTLFLDLMLSFRL